MIAFRIAYLTGAVRAADFTAGNDKSAPEWPPHPSRLFSALVSAWAASGASAAGRVALEWLEQQGAPALVVSEGSEVGQREPVLRSYVPANDDASLGQLRRRNPRRFPAITPASEVVYMIWPNAEPSVDVLGALRDLPRLIPNLGHSSSLADVRLTIEAPPPSLVPVDVGALRLRVPAPGRLSTLEHLYQSGRRPDAGRWQAYASPVQPRAAAAVGAFGDMVVYRLKPVGFAIPLAGTLNVCVAMRGAVLANAEEPIPEVISGHAAASAPEHPLPTQRAHLAFVPLPDVGHRHARGHIMGVAAVLPRTIEASERRSCLRALGRVQELVLGRLGRVPVERQGIDVEARALTTETWMAPTRVWATVTPVVLGRFPKEPFGVEAEQVVAESCRISGYPVPESVELGRVSWVLGAPIASDFPSRAEGPGRPKRFHVHARLSFADVVAGPVMIGAGRHYGYGLCRPLHDEP